MCLTQIVLIATHQGFREKCVRQMCRVGQNRIYTPYMTVYLLIFLPKFSYIHRIYMVLANPTIVLDTTHQFARHDMC